MYAGSTCCVSIRISVAFPSMSWWIQRSAGLQVGSEILIYIWVGRMSRRWVGLTHSCEGQKVQVPQQQTCLSCLAKAPLESIPALAVAPHPLPRARLDIRGACNTEHGRRQPVVQTDASHCPLCTWIGQSWLPPTPLLIFPLHPLSINCLVLSAVTIARFSRVHFCNFDIFHRGQFHFCVCTKCS